jgi:YbgC/YbaW family acyl-CoA thioester hydrolase|tara:strand:- start:150 stop:527 length:378 start_codon:yes stop_codon:yes gene_type:complete
MAGIVHFASFFPYMEDCEHDFYRSLNLSVTDMHDDSGVNIGWPRVHASCDYKRPLRFEEPFIIKLTIQKIGKKTIEYNFDFTSTDKVITYATGSLIVVCVKFNESGMDSIEIPDNINALLINNTI